MRKIKVAQIGIQHDHAGAAYRSITHLNDIFEVVGLAVEPEEDSRYNNNVQDINGSLYEGHNLMTVEEIFNIPDLDAVIIETNEIASTKYAIMAAERGIAVYLDKPGGIVLSDFEKLVETVKKNNVVFHTGYMYRYNPAVIEALELVKSGELGKICSVEAQMNCYHGDVKRQWLGGFPGGMMFFLGCHLVDLVINFAGLPKEVIPLNMSSGWGGVTADDMGMAIFKYDNANAFIKSSATEHCGFMRRQLVITGEKGTIEINPLEMYVRDTPFDNHSTRMRVSTRSHGVDIASWRAIGEWKEFEPFDRHDGMMTSFAEMVRGEKVNPYTPDYELEVYKHVLKACGSSEIK